jgi:hypothetical protein
MIDLWHTMSSMRHFVVVLMINLKNMNVKVDIHIEPSCMIKDHILIMPFVRYNRLFHLFVLCSMRLSYCYPFCNGRQMIALVMPMIIILWHYLWSRMVLSNHLISTKTNLVHSTWFFIPKICVSNVSMRPKYVHFFLANDAKIRMQGINNWK